MGFDGNDLKGLPLFSTLTESEISEIRACVLSEKFKKKEAIFDEGDPSDWFYLLMSGKVKITKISHDGREIILEIISPPEIFGGLAVLKGFPYPANASAMEDSEVIKITRANLLKIIDRFPHIMFEMTANLGDRVREFHDTMKNIALERVEARIAALLIKLADKTGEKSVGGETVINMRLTKQDIAEMVGTTVETAIRVMSRFRKSGFIGDDTGRIGVRNPEALRAVVNPLS